MAITQFDDPVLESDYSLSVGGPFLLTPDERSRLIGDVVIRFLVIQDHKLNEGIATDDAMAEGIATWPAGGPSLWQGSVLSHHISGTFVKGARVRGIGTAVLVFQSPTPSPDEPPSIDTITWCVAKKVA
jgi:hypothetical protein